MIPGDRNSPRLRPNVDLVAKPWKDSPLDFSCICEDPNGTTNLPTSYPHLVDSLLDDLVKYFQVKLACALAIPLPEPDGRSPPGDWAIVE